MDCNVYGEVKANFILQKNIIAVNHPLNPSKTMGGNIICYKLSHFHILNNFPYSILEFIWRNRGTGNHCVPRMGLNIKMFKSNQSVMGKTNTKKY